MQPSRMISPILYGHGDWHIETKVASLQFDRFLIEFPIYREVFAMSENA